MTHPEISNPKTTSLKSGSVEQLEDLTAYDKEVNLQLEDLTKEDHALTRTLVRYIQLFKFVEKKSQLININMIHCIHM